MNNISKKKLAIPDGMLIILGIIFLCVFLTWLIPAGQYTRVVDEVSGLKVVDPASFTYIESSKVNLFSIPRFIVDATIAQSEMIFFLLFIGGCYELIMKCGVFQAFISKLIKLNIKEEIFIPLFTMVFAIIAAPAGGTITFIGFAPIFVMIARAMGYDALVGISLVLVGGAVGCAAGPITPFTTGVAQKIADLPMYSGLGYRILCLVIFWAISSWFIVRYAKKIKKNPLESHVYELEEREKGQRVSNDYSSEITWRQIVIFLGFVGTLSFIIYGCLKLGWNNRTQMAIYLMLTVFVGIIGRFSANDVVKTFIKGAQGMLTAALVLGLSRTIGMILDEAKVLDTVIYGCANMLNLLPTYLRGGAMFLANTVINCFIISGSGQAAAVMPIFVPVADIVGMTRQTAVLAFNFGDGFSNWILPHSAPLLGFLGAVNIPYEKWVKFFWKLFALWVISGIILVSLAHIMNYGPF